MAWSRFLAISQRAGALRALSGTRSHQTNLASSGVRRLDLSPHIKRGHFPSRKSSNDPCKHQIWCREGPKWSQNRGPDPKNGGAATTSCYLASAMSWASSPEEAARPTRCQPAYADAHRKANATGAGMMREFDLLMVSSFHGLVCWIASAPGRRGGALPLQDCIQANDAAFEGGVRRILAPVRTASSRSSV